MVLQLAQAATRQIEDADIRAHIRDPTQAAKAVDLSRDLHYILINICQGAAATVVRQNRYNANGCETLRLLHNKEDTTRAKEKATQDPKDMAQAKATKAKETTANQKGKETTTTQHAIDVASPATGHKTAECQYGT